MTDTPHLYDGLPSPSKKPRTRYMVLQPNGRAASFAQPTPSDAIDHARRGQSLTWYDMQGQGFELVELTGTPEPYLSVVTSLPASIHEHMAARAQRAGQSLSELISLACRDWLIHVADGEKQ
jgi:hypothetical protein